MDILLLSSVLEHGTEGLHTTHTGTKRSSDLGGVDVLVELVRVGDTRVDQGLHGAHEGPKSSPVSLSDNVVRDTESTSVPTRGDLTSDKSVESDSLGDENSSSLLELGEVLAGCLSPDVDLVALLSLESSGVIGRNLDGLEVVVELNLLVEGLLLRIVAVEDLGFCRQLCPGYSDDALTNETDTSMAEDFLLVLGSNILVIDRVSRLGIDPSNVALAVLELAVEVLDQAHHPSHLDATLDGELSPCLHLPSGSRASPGTDLSETGAHNDLVEINQALEVLKLLKDVLALNLGELVREVGPRGD